MFWATPKQLTVRLSPESESQTLGSTHPTHPAPILSSEFLNQNYLGSSFIFGKLPNIICVRETKICFGSDK